MSASGMGSLSRSLALLLYLVSISYWMALAQEGEMEATQAVVTPEYTQLYVCDSSDPSFLGTYKLVCPYS